MVPQVLELLRLIQLHTLLILFINFFRYLLQLFKAPLLVFAYIRLSVNSFAADRESVFHGPQTALWLTDGMEMG